MVAEACGWAEALRRGRGPLVRALGEMFGVVRPRAVRLIHQLSGGICRAG